MSTLETVGTELNAINEQLVAMLALMHAGQISEDSKEAWDEWLAGSLERLSDAARDLVTYGLDYDGEDGEEFRIILADTVNRVERGQDLLTLAREAVREMRPRI
jgi:hypothetical protein